MTQYSCCHLQLFHLRFLSEKEIPWKFERPFMSPLAHEFEQNNTNLNCIRS